MEIGCEQDVERKEQKTSCNSSSTLLLRLLHDDLCKHILVIDLFVLTSEADCEMKFANQSKFWKRVVLSLLGASSGRGKSHLKVELYMFGGSFQLLYTLKGYRASRLFITCDHGICMLDIKLSELVIQR